MDQPPPVVEMHETTYQHITMKKTLLTIAAAGLLLAGAGLRAAETPAPFTLSLPIAPGTFQGTMDSLTNYTCPEWFRDAKFGIWAHWGPQAVPMEGDWYARKMYQQG